MERWAPCFIQGDDSQRLKEWLCTDVQETSQEKWGMRARAQSAGVPAFPQKVKSGGKPDLVRSYWPFKDFDFFYVKPKWWREGFEHACLKLQVKVLQSQQVPGKPLPLCSLIHTPCFLEHRLTWILSQHSGHSTWWRKKERNGFKLDQPNSKL